MNKNRKLTRLSIDFILAFSEGLREKIDHWKATGEKEILDVSGGYIYETMLNFAYNILINEGYPKKHLDEFFYNYGEPDKHKEWTEKACKFYNINRKTSSEVIEEFFDKNFKLKKEMEKFGEV